MSITYHFKIYIGMNYNQSATRMTGSQSGGYKSHVKYATSCRPFVILRVNLLSSKMLVTQNSCHITENLNFRTISPFHVEIL